MDSAGSTTEAESQGLEFTVDLIVRETVFLWLYTAHSCKQCRLSHENIAHHHLCTNAVRMDRNIHLSSVIQKHTGSNDSSIYLQEVSFSFGRQTGPEPLERPGPSRHIKKNHEEENTQQ